MQRSKIKHQNCGVPASRDDFNNFALCTLIFDYSMAWKSLVIVIAVVLMLVTGCGQKETPNVRRSRAVAAENIELKKELDRSEARLHNLKEQYDKELEKERELLERCKQERDEWKAKSKQNVREQAKSLIDPLMEEITRLREENRKLTAQLEELKK